MWLYTVDTNILKDNDIFRLGSGSTTWTWNDPALLFVTCLMTEPG